jgi:hypothetical protein
MGRSTLRRWIPALPLLAACAGTDASSPAGPDRAAAWDAAVTYAEFVAGDTAHQALWSANAGRGAPADLVARARRGAGGWRLLVLAENWCSDAAYSVPFLAALADSLPALELRLLRVEGNEELLAGHARNGRAAHPVVLLLDGAGRERGAWVERPAELAAWIDARRGSIPDDDIRLYRRGWYEGNAGRAAVAEMLDLMADARAGRTPAVAPATAGAGREVTPCPAPEA